MRVVVCDFISIVQISGILIYVNILIFVYYTNNKIKFGGQRFGS